MQAPVETRIVSRPAGLVAATATLLAALATSVSAQVTARVDLDAAGAQTNDQSFYSAISGDGRFVAFQSDATNLVAGDTNALRDVFVRDRQSGTCQRVSVDSAGAQANGASNGPSISADGRYVAFMSEATNLVLGDTNGRKDIFVRDLLLGTTERVSVESTGFQGNGDSDQASISADGRFVGFTSAASNLVPGDTNGGRDVFVRDRQNGTTERVSVDSAGLQGDSESVQPFVSADGRYVSFSSFAGNLVAGDTNGGYDVFLRDRQSGVTERISVTSAGAQAEAGSSYSAVTFDGRYVAFQSYSTNLVPGDTGFHSDIFVRDRQLGTTERVSLDSGGNQGGLDSREWPSISADGRYVAFLSDAINLVPADTNSLADIFVRDRQLATTERVSVSSSGAQGTSGPISSGCYSAAMSADGRWVAFVSGQSNLVPADTNGKIDIFVRDRTGGPAFTSLCDPGVGGVIACPCGNPPSGAGRGCNNSSSTGGAILTAAGGTYLSSDSLVFATSGEKPSALSIVSQWTGTSATGVVFGQGVRCASGGLKRLYTRSAVGGSITAPDFGSGDPQVSVRSATLGDPILAGQSRWYLVYYRDPIVLGGCPSTSTFNATQTGEVVWVP